jgi:hypothetical protein
MDQKPIVVYLRMKGMAFDAIHDNLVCMLGKNAVTYSTVTKYARSAQFSGRKKATPPEAPDVERSPVDEAILTALANFRFRLCATFREDLSSEIHRAPALHAITSLHGGTSSMGPPLLTAEQKQIRVEMAIELLQVLSVQSTRQWHDSVTLDESWIYLFSEHDLMWTAPGEIVVDRERHTVQSPTFMLTVVLNPIRFHVMQAFPKGANSMHNIIQMVSWSQSQIGGGRPGEYGQILWVHSDNARPHTAKMSKDYIGLNRMKQALHPSYSPDLAPSDVFLFGYVKRKLMKYRTETLSELLVRIRVILAEIPRETLNAVFLEWTERLQKCVQVDGEYVG